MNPHSPPLLTKAAFNPNQCGRGAPSSSLPTPAPCSCSLKVRQPEKPFPHRQRLGSRLLPVLPRTCDPFGCAGLIPLLPEGQAAAPGWTLGSDAAAGLFQAWRSGAMCRKRGCREGGGEAAASPSAFSLGRSLSPPQQGLIRFPARFLFLLHGLWCWFALCSA